jgi:hypothetical protein
MPQRQESEKRVAEILESGSIQPSRSEIEAAAASMTAMAAPGPTDPQRRPTYPTSVAALCCAKEATYPASVAALCSAKEATGILRPRRLNGDPDLPEGGPLKCHMTAVLQPRTPPAQAWPVP